MYLAFHKKFSGWNSYARTYPFGLSNKFANVASRTQFLYQAHYDRGT